MEEETDVELEVGGGFEPKEAELVYDEAAPNLVETFASTEKGRKALKRLADQVRKDFDAAWSGAEAYRERIANDFKIFTGDLPKKSFPFEDSANANVPIMLETLSRVTARSSSELFGDWTNVFSVLPMTPDDEQLAYLLTKHGNWQIRNELTDFRRQIGSRGMLLFYTAGDVVCHSYYDSAKKRNRHDILTCDEFFMPYVFTTTEPDLSDVPYMGKVLHRYRHELQRMRGEWSGVDEVIAREPPSWDDDPEQVAHESMAQTMGIEKPDDSSRAPYKLIEYVGWAELPNQENDRFIRAIMDYTTKNLLLLQIHEEEDWQDRARFDRQNEELERYRAARAAEAEHQAMVEQAAGMVDPMTGMPIDVNMIHPPPEPAIPPGWAENPDDPMTSPDPIRMVPIRLFTHAVCIEPLVGSLGIGFGRIQSDFNAAANVAFSQYTDAATLANVCSYITPEGVEFDQPFSVRPGAINKVKGIGPSDLGNAIKELRPSPANEQLVNVIKMMYDWGQSAIQAPAVLSGEPGKSGETYRGLSTRVEQATRQLSVVTRVYADFVEGILKNNAKLNAQFLPDEQILYLNDTKFGGGEEIVVGRSMYQRDYRVEIRSDLRFASQAQKISEADELLQMPGAVPPLQTDTAFVHHAVRKALEARNKHEMIPLLGPPPPPPTTPFGAPPPMPGMPPGAPAGMPDPSAAGAPPDMGGEPPPEEAPV